MCFRVECKQCRKYSWSGCGKHLTTLYASIGSGKHCMCRPWPGVVLPEPEPEPEPEVTRQQPKEGDIASSTITSNILSESKDGSSKKVTGMRSTEDNTTI